MYRDAHLWLLQVGSETYHHLKKLIQAKYGLKAANVGDEGGFSPPLSTFEDALDLLVSAIKVSHRNGIISATGAYTWCQDPLDMRMPLASLTTARQGSGAVTIDAEEKPD